MPGRGTALRAPASGGSVFTRHTGVYVDRGKFERVRRTTETLTCEQREQRRQPRPPAECFSRCFQGGLSHFLRWHLTLNVSFQLDFERHGAKSH